MKAIVLNAKRGVITEERFQKLTPLQWLFHYKEVMQGRNRDKEYVESLVESLQYYLELVGTMANPAAGKELQEFKKLDKARKEIPEEEFPEIWEEIVDMIPKELLVTDTSSEENKFSLPKYNKSRELKVNKK